MRRASDATPSEQQQQQQNGNNTQACGYVYGLPGMMILLGTSKEQALEPETASCADHNNRLLGT